MAEKTRYTDEELAEFKQIILDKLELARRDYQHASKSLSKVCKLHSSALKIRLMVSAALQANSYLRNVYAQYPTPL